MKLVMVTNYPPDRRALSEYGYHLTAGLRTSNPDHELVVLSGKFSDIQSTEEQRVWSFGSVLAPYQILQEIRRQRPDVVLFNTLFTAWGGNLANLAGLLTPWLVRKAGFRTVVLLHHIPQTMDAKKAGYRLTPIHRLAIELACRAIATSDVVCFTLQKDQDYFTAHYRPQRTVFVQHGLLGDSKWAALPRNENRVLAFGKWGRSKNPKDVIRGFLAKDIAGQLVVAGGSSHTKNGFMEQIQSQYASEQRITFTGYVLEADIPQLFHSAHVVVLPYEENTGISGVLHQTCQYGRVPIIKDLPVFRKMVEELGLRVYFYKTEDDLGETLQWLLNRRSLLEEAGMINFQAVQHLRMERVADRYWEIFASLESASIDKKQTIPGLQERSKR